MTTLEERNLRARAIRLQNNSAKKLTLAEAMMILTSVEIKD